MSTWNADRTDDKERRVGGGGRSLRSELFAGVEWAALKASPVYYGFGVPHGDGSPVVLVPGFLGSDLSLLELHLWLGRMGYRSHLSGIGVNAECPDALLARLQETVDRVYRESGQRVTLIGHSLGGLLARAAAGRDPLKVKQVITMGTPAQRLAAHPTVLRLLGKVLRRSYRSTKGRCLRSFGRGLRACLPASVSVAAICGRDDPVVAWRDCLDPNAARNIEVSGTHTGLPVNPAVYRELARLLALPERAPKLVTPQPASTAVLPLAA
jgi:pimeloyl-ACP methyl ester carboxylesterase